MKQQTLEPVAETVAAEQARSAGALIPANSPANTAPDMTTALMATPSEFLPARMEEIKARRDLVRKWLLSLMERGLHYGHPAGEKKDTKDWKDKPSLYQSGADLVIEAECLRPEFFADEAACRIINRPNVLIYGCRLYSQITGQLLGEGRGAAVVGSADFDANKATKMACKRSKVAAVLNTYGLSDIFSQDREHEDRKSPAAETPRNPNAPKARPRTGRVSKEQVGEIADLWKKDRASKDMPTTPEDFSAWVHATTGIEQRSALNSGSWIPANIDTCREALTGVAF